MRVILSLLRYNREFAFGVLLLGFVIIFASLSFFSPYPPNDSFVVPPDVPPSWAYPLGTTSRGQDVFWLLTFAIRNTLLFGLVFAAFANLGILARQRSLVVPFMLLLLCLPKPQRTPSLPDHSVLVSSAAQRRARENRQRVGSAASRA